MPHISEERISTYIDKQLNAGESLALEAHLKDCDGCRGIFEGMLEVTRLFREAERVTPSPFLWNRIAADLNKRPIGTWKTLIVDGLRSYNRSLGLAAAALVLLLAGGIVMFRENARRVGERAALAEINQIHQSLAAQDPDAYNPFSSDWLRDLEANPFRSMRSSGKTATGN
jgi:anti-sigma factor RsiW